MPLQHHPQFTEDLFLEGEKGRFLLYGPQTSIDTNGLSLPFRFSNISIKMNHIKRNHNETWLVQYLTKPK